MDKKKILKLYNDVKSNSKKLEELSEEELICVSKLYNQEINLMKERIEKENREIYEIKKRIEKLIKKK